MTNRLDEKPPSVGDDLKTSLKAFGSRFGNAAKATAGSYFNSGYGARGKLAVRILADRLMQRWLVISHGVGMPATRENIYRLVQREYGKVIDDATMRSIIGLPPGPPSTAPAKTQDRPKLTYNVKIQAMIDASLKLLEFLLRLRNGGTA